MRNHLKLVKVYVNGKRTQLDLGKITFGRVVQVTPTKGVDDLQLILVETATIEYGRNCRWSSCPWTKLPLVELSLDEIAVGRVVLGRNCRGSSCPWTKLPWVELSLDEIAVGRVVLGRNCRGSSCPWTKLPWVELSLVNLENFQREDDQYLKDFESHSHSYVLG